MACLSLRIIGIYLGAKKLPVNVTMANIHRAIDEGILWQKKSRPLAVGYIINGFLGTATNNARLQSPKPSPTPVSKLGVVAYSPPLTWSGYTRVSKSFHVLRILVLPQADRLQHEAF